MTYLPKYLLLLGLFVPLAWAHHFTGTYALDTGEGTVTLVLQHGSDGALVGTLAGAGESFSLAGFADPEGGYGDVTTPDAVLGFEAYLSEDDRLLGFYLFEYAPGGEADRATVQEFVFERRSFEADLGSAPAPAPAPAPGAAADNPLGPPRENDPLAGGANPLAAPAPLVGRFSDGAVTLTLWAEGAAYSGQLEFDGQTFPVTAEGAAASLRGSFESDGGRFAFDAALQGDTLTFSTGGSSYTLVRQQDAANPLAAASAGPPNAGPGIRKPDPTSPVIARGRYAELRQDDALAFIEALEFSLMQVGYAYTFTDADRQQLLQAIVQEYPLAAKEDQLVLARARDIWNRVQSNWAGSSIPDRQIFILGVLTLAFGEETVQQNLGQQNLGQGSTAVGAGSGSSCEQLEDCMSMFAPDAYQDMIEAQGCWASAGCTNYDSTTDTYTYEEYNPTYDTYDTYDY